MSRVPFEGSVYGNSERHENVYNSGMFYLQFNMPGIECSTPEPLGLEDRTIPDESISVSSSYFAWSGRLNGVAWVPRYVAVDIFYLPRTLSGQQLTKNHVIDTHSIS